jgi:hypothetical protein
VPPVKVVEEGVALDVLGSGLLAQPILGVADESLHEVQRWRGDLVLADRREVGELQHFLPRGDVVEDLLHRVGHKRRVACSGWSKSSNQISVPSPLVKTLELYVYACVRTIYHLKEENADGPPIGGFVVALLLGVSQSHAHDLRRHVLGRSYHRVGLNADAHAIGEHPDNG